MRSFLLRPLLALTLFTAAASASAAPAAVLRFEGGIGVDPLTAAGGTDQLNTVRGVAPGGRAWVIRKLDAAVYADGSIVVRGKGLLFASGEAIATRGPVAQVVATLACGPADATATRYTSEAGALDPSGTFTIRGTLRGTDGNIAPLATTACANPLLLVRASPTGGWFAAGILQGDDD